MISLTQRQIEVLNKKAKPEINRNIYTIHFDKQEITINGDWGIERDGKPICENIVSAIETYCTKDNIMWEFNSTYGVIK